MAGRTRRDTLLAALGVAVTTMNNLRIYLWQVPQNPAVQAICPIRDVRTN